MQQRLFLGFPKHIQLELEINCRSSSMTSGNQLFAFLIRMAKKTVFLDHNIPPGGKTYVLVNWENEGSRWVGAESLAKAREMQAYLWARQVNMIRNSRGDGSAAAGTDAEVNVLPRKEAERVADPPNSTYQAAVVGIPPRPRERLSVQACQRKEQAFRAHAEALWRDVQPSLNYNDVAGALVLALMSRKGTL